MYIRKINKTGQVVIPNELRKKLSSKAGDLFEVYIEDNKIILRKLELTNLEPEPVQLSIL